MAHAFSMPFAGMYILNEQIIHSFSYKLNVEFMSHRRLAHITALWSFVSSISW